MLIDTHAHIHFDSFRGEVNEVLARAREAGVGKIITVGVNSDDSRKAVEMAARYENVWAAVGVHPHSAEEIEQAADYIADLAKNRQVVAVGECGLDYYKSQASREQQAAALRKQLELAAEIKLPVIFHVREAFSDFFKIYDGYDRLPGVVHSFTGTPAEMRGAVERGLHVALNGIMTFTKDEGQLQAAKELPLDRLLLETDCPYLTPAPDRGKRNEPANVKPIAEFLAELRGESIQELSRQTTANACQLFGI
ncbi:MAG TPA: TatD family hydrolase [Candidatus Dormibacteraeota bacterium]|nr:TatD family hydrolase [Candidatus Dormibacteraeota bacterium]